MKFNIKILLIVIFISLPLYSIDFTTRKEVITFINFISKKYKIDKAYLVKLFKNIRKNSKIELKNKNNIPYSYNHSKEVTGKWLKYAQNHIGQNRIIYGVDFLKKYKITLNKIYKKYNVSPEYIVAIIGIETFYGNNIGRYYVFDHLVKLSFNENRRSKFYKFELKELFKLYKNRNIDIENLIGSSAGAIGLGQFMPSIYNHFGVDFNNDKEINMMDPIDSIASIANYFKDHNWKDDQPVAIRAYYKNKKDKYKNIGLKFKYKIENLNKSYLKEKFNYTKKIYLITLDFGGYDQLWYATNNFYSITRYNHSIHYAMAIFQLAIQIKKLYIKQYRHYIINK